MLYIEFLVDGERRIVSGADNMHEVGKEVKKFKPFLAAGNPDAEITVLVDGEKINETPIVDVRRIARNMKTQYIENKLLGCHDI